MKQYNVPMELMGNILMLDVSLWSKKVNRFRNMMLVFDTGTRDSPLTVNFTMFFLSDCYASSFGEGSGQAS